jgi:hypothetical protein
MRNDAILHNKPRAEDRADGQGFSIRDNEILDALETISFVSIRQIAKISFIPHTAVFGQLIKSSLCSETIALGSPQTLGSSKTGSDHHGIM